MKTLSCTICITISLMALAQEITFGDSTSFSTGASTSFYAGGNTTFGGTITNGGTLIFNRNVNFGANRNVGSLRFVGATDQSITSSDTLFITDLEVDKQGRLTLSTPRILVSGNLNVTSGVVQSNNVGDLLVTGQSGGTGLGYVEGKLVGLTSGNPVTFPMGVNGFRNYLTFSNTTPGVVLLVDCRLPNPDSLLASEEMIGIADEVEWAVRTVTGTTAATVTVDFSGLDFVNFSNGQQILADLYEPAITVIQRGDTIHQILTSTEASPQNNSSTSTTGRVVSSTSVRLDTSLTRIAVAWLPIIDGPEFFVPNAFSPSGFEEDNRIFRPFFAGGVVTSVSMAVYNTYNEQVFSYADSGPDLDLETMGWNGLLSGGQEAAAGVYYYQIQLVADGQVYQKTASVLLVK